MPYPYPQGQGDPNEYFDDSGYWGGMPAQRSNYFDVGGIDYENDYQYPGFEGPGGVPWYDDARLRREEVLRNLPDGDRVRRSSGNGDTPPVISGGGDDGGGGGPEIFNPAPYELELRAMHERYLVERLRQLEIPEMRMRSEAERKRLALDSAVQWAQLTGVVSDPRVFQNIQNYLSYESEDYSKEPDGEGGGEGGGEGAEEKYNTPNGPKTLAEMEAELRDAGWQGGEDIAEAYARTTEGEVAPIEGGEGAGPQIDPSTQRALDKVGQIFKEQYGREMTEDEGLNWLSNMAKKEAGTLDPSQERPWDSAANLLPRGFEKYIRGGKWDRGTGTWTPPLETPIGQPPGGGIPGQPRYTIPGAEQAVNQRGGVAGSLAQMGLDPMQAQAIAAGMPNFQQGQVPTLEFQNLANDPRSLAQALTLGGYSRDQIDQIFQNTSLYRQMLPSQQRGDYQALPVGEGRRLSDGHILPVGPVSPPQGQYPPISTPEPVPPMYGVNPPGSPPNYTGIGPPGWNPEGPGAPGLRGSVDNGNYATIEQGFGPGYYQRPHQSIDDNIHGQMMPGYEVGIGPPNLNPHPLGGGPVGIGPPSLNPHPLRPSPPSNNMPLPPGQQLPMPSPPQASAQNPFSRGSRLPVRQTLRQLKYDPNAIQGISGMASFYGKDPQQLFGEFIQSAPQGGRNPLTRFA